MKLLAVDDDSISRKAMLYMLGSFEGLRCEEAVDGEDAWTRITTGVMPLLVCCDVRMPRLDGLGLLQRLRGQAATRELPVVLVTSANDMDTVRQAAQYGAAGFLIKPLHQEEARPRLAKALELAQLKALEPAADTQRRLSLTPARHQAYLRALQGQLAPLFEGSTLVDLPMLPRRARLEALQGGLTTLGLWRAAALLAALGRVEDVSAMVPETWDELRQQIALQSQRAAPALATNL